jgi:hypothetical protein
MKYLLYKWIYEENTGSSSKEPLIILQSQTEAKEIAKILNGNEGKDYDFQQIQEL